MNEILFYTGIAITAISLLAAVIGGVLNYTEKIKLNNIFDKEYGEQPNFENKQL